MYCTTDEVKEYLGITSNKQDSLIERCILSAQRQIEQYTVKVFENSGESTKTFDAYNEYVSKSGYLFTVPYDLRTISAITIDGNDVSSYIVKYKSFDDIIYEIKLITDSPYSFNHYSTSVENTINITGNWGYSANPPEDIKQACIVLAQYQYQRKDATITGERALLPNTQGNVKLTYSIPIDVKNILDRYRRVVLYDYS
jgi:hypothetical protein